jgi:murein tripeptide amidase MpaA
VNSAELWINPNANPDGTYYGGNSTVASARRYNNNGYDLNRNFPIPMVLSTAEHPGKLKPL